MILSCLNPAQPIVYGVRDIKPISNLPEGAKVRIRMRPKALALAYVKHGGAVTCWGLQEDSGGDWILGLKMGQNATVKGKEDA